MSDDLVLGMIGAGNIATRHLANLEFLGRNRIVGLCDLDLDKAKELSGRCGAKPYTNFEEMFDREPELISSSLSTYTKNWKPETVNLGSTGRIFLPLQNGWTKSMPVFRPQILSSLLSALIQ